MYFSGRTGACSVAAMPLHGSRRRGRGCVGADRARRGDAATTGVALPARLGRTAAPESRKHSIKAAHLSTSHAIVIGASTGGVAALLELVSGLPKNFPAVVGVVLHVGAFPSILPQLLSARGVLPAQHPSDGERLRPGRIYVAPPDHHMLFTADEVRLSRGPRENHARPAIDPLFRTTALHWRERSIGVVLTGQLDDGTA